MDKYNERLIKSKAGVGNIIALVASIFLTLIGAILVILSPPLGVLIFSGGIALIVISKDGLRQELEFIITNGDIEVAKIIAKKKRKAVDLIQAEQIAKMDRADSDKVKNDISLGKIKTIKYIGKEPGENLVAIYEGEGDKQTLYILDFDEKCIDHMNQVLKVKSEIR